MLLASGQVGEDQSGVIGNDGFRNRASVFGVDGLDEIIRSDRVASGAEV